MTARQIGENEPLSPTERERLHNALDAASLVTEFCVLGLLYTGLTPSELAHLQHSLLRDRDVGKLLVFQEVECRSGGGWAAPIRWEPTGEKNIGEACGLAQCDGVYQFDRDPVPVRHERTNQVLDEFFRLHKVTPCKGTINNRVRKFGESCGIDRLNGSVLRYTYPVILAEQGFNRDEIADVLSIAENTKENINFTEDVGAYCSGANPFACNECGQPARTGGNFCTFHLEGQPICGEPLTDGSRCGVTVSDEDGRCWAHKDLPRCGEETGRGAKSDCCKNRVEAAEDKCWIHSE